tara:strand:+ start:296 stop:820 length:525 start_codon:yes stop_codon:yes gene_type:complete
MKRLILLITLFITGATFAQVEKASDGKIYEVMFTPNLDGANMFALNNPLSGHVTMRTFNDANSVTRWKAHFSYLDIDGMDDAAMTLGLQYGKEKHHDGSDRLATFTGWQAGLLYADDGADDATVLNGGVFVGANYYIADNLYIGTEISYNLVVGEDSTVVSPGVNGMLSIGFKL